MPAHPLHEPVLAWYSANARELPWRRADRTAWGVLVSEVMLQQTPVVRVLPAWTAWMARWTTPRDLAEDEPGAAIRAWDRLRHPPRGLGLDQAPGRQVRLDQPAVEIVARHGVDVPAELDDLLALPGIGSYAAAAVASFAFG